MPFSAAMAPRSTSFAGRARRILQVGNKVMPPASGLESPTCFSWLTASAREAAR
jgi:hypothetical protein